MKHFFFNQTALYLTVEKENIEIIKLLLSIDKFDINNLDISSQYLFLQLNLKYFNRIHIKYLNAIQIKYFNYIQIKYFNVIKIKYINNIQIKYLNIVSFYFLSKNIIFGF